MHRIGCRTQGWALRSSIRHNSTEPPSKPKRAVRVPLVRLGDILIPSAEEIRAKTAASAKSTYDADISYLQNASDNYLAAKLARLGLQGNSEQESSEPLPVLPLKRSRPVLTPDEIAAITARRREERQARTAEKVQQHLRSHVPVPNKAEILRTQIEKSTTFVSPERTTESKLADTKRRIERLRQNNQLQNSGTPRKETTSRQDRVSRKQPKARETARKPETKGSKQRVAPAVLSSERQPKLTFEEEINEVFQRSGYEPEFNGPEHLSSNLLDQFGSSCGAKDVTLRSESGKTVKIPLSRVDSFLKGDYSRHVTTSADGFATPPDALGAVKVAERTLSHQRQFSLNERDRALKVVAQAVHPFSKAATKAS